MANPLKEWLRDRQLAETPGTDGSHLAVGPFTVELTVWPVDGDVLVLLKLNTAEGAPEGKPDSMLLDVQVSGSVAREQAFAVFVNTLDFARGASVTLAGSIAATATSGTAPAALEIDYLNAAGQSLQAKLEFDLTW